MVGTTMGLEQVVSGFGGASLITDFGTEGGVLVTELSDEALLGVSLLSFVSTSFISVDCFLIGVELADIFSTAAFFMSYSLYVRT